MLKLKENSMSEVDAEILDGLNDVLSNQLTAINQYFLHARMMKHLGFMKLADNEYKESIQQMKYADRLVERILSLGGIPNLQELKKLKIGKTVHDILKCDLAVEEGMVGEIKSVAALCESRADVESAKILYGILENDNNHGSFIRAQLKQVDIMGLPQYLQTQV